MRRDGGRRGGEEDETAGALNGSGPRHVERANAEASGQLAAGAGMPSGSNSAVKCRSTGAEATIR